MLIYITDSSLSSLKSASTEFSQTDNEHITTKGSLFRYFGMLSYTEGNHRVLECIFSELTNHAILFNSTNENSKLLTDFCFFSSVSCENDNGGAIYLQNLGYVCINRVCAINCHCGDHSGHFFYSPLLFDLINLSILNFSRTSIDVVLKIKGCLHVPLMHANLN